MIPNYSCIVLISSYVLFLRNENEIINNSNWSHNGVHQKNEKKTNISVNACLVYEDYKGPNQQYDSDTEDDNEY